MTVAERVAEIDAQMAALHEEREALTALGDAALQVIREDAARLGVSELALLRTVWRAGKQVG